MVKWCRESPCELGLFQHIDRVVEKIRLIERSRVEAGGVTLTRLITLIDLAYVGGELTKPTVLTPSRYLGWIRLARSGREASAPALQPASGMTPLPIQSKLVRAAEMLNIR